MFPLIRNPNSALATRPTSLPVNRLSSLFDRFFEDPFAPWAPTTWSAMPLSMWEDEHNVYVEVDAPGVTDKDIELSVQDGALVIRGERKCQQREGTFDTRSYGQFEQRISLPSGVDANNVEARLVNGVLTVTLPKTPEAKPRRIAIRTA